MNTKEPFPHQKLILKIRGMVSRMLLTQSDRVIVTSNEVADYIQKLVRARVSLIPKGIDNDFWQSANSSTTDAGISLEKGKLKVGYNGYLNRWQKADIILNVAKSTLQEYDIHYYLIVDDQEKEHLLDRVFTENISNVSIYGIQPHVSLPIILNQFDIVLILIKQLKEICDTLYLQILGSMLLGKSLIIELNSSTKKILQESNAGISIKPGSQDELREAILKLYLEPDLLTLLGKNGRRYVDKYFLKDELAAKYLSVIQESFE